MIFGAKTRIFLLFIAFFVLLSSQLWALNEKFESYTPPQAHAMGYALTADAYGVLANFYNPAGLAKGSIRKWEVTLADVVIVEGLSALGSMIATRSISTLQITKALQNSPGVYNFYQIGGVPSISRRNFGFSPLLSYRYAAQSDGTNVDMDTVIDIAPTLGVASNFLGNRLKVGITGKAILRNQIQGNYAHSQIQSEEALGALSREGIGLGFDVGALYTFANRFLPTIGVVWRDVLGTQFYSATNILKPHASGLPNSIAQSINIAGSLRPRIGKKLVSTWAVEYKHLEDFTLPFEKKFHLGLQIEDEKSFFIWLGLNKMFLTFGFALRLPGGNLELSTYGEEVGTPTVSKEDRRIAIRYTIGF